MLLLWGFIKYILKSNFCDCKTFCVGVQVSKSSLSLILAKQVPRPKRVKVIQVFAMKARGAVQIEGWHHDKKRDLFLSFTASMWADGTHPGSRSALIMLWLAPSSLKSICFCPRMQGLGLAICSCLACLPLLPSKTHSSPSNPPTPHAAATYLAADSTYSTEFRVPIWLVGTCDKCLRTGFS